MLVLHSYLPSDSAPATKIAVSPDRYKHWDVATDSDESEEDEAEDFDMLDEDATPKKPGMFYILSSASSYLISFSCSIRQEGKECWYIAHYEIITPC